jgi:hypothetical protein
MSEYPGHRLIYQALRGMPVEGSDRIRVAAGGNLSHGEWAMIYSQLLASMGPVDGSGLNTERETAQESLHSHTMRGERWRL